MAEAPSGRWSRRAPGIPPEARRHLSLGRWRPARRRSPSTAIRRPARPGDGTSETLDEDLHRYIAPSVGPDDERRVHRLRDRDRAPLRRGRRRPRARGAARRARASTRSRAGSIAGMYRDRLWTMRQYAGYASAEETNRRYRYLIEHGSTGLSMAFDLPTQLGRDSDEPALRRRGGPHRGRDRHDRGHADLLRPDPARRGLDLDDDQRAGRDPAAALRAGRRGAGRPRARSFAGRSRTTC